MSGLLGNFARAFPFLTFLAVVALLLFLFRSWSRVSSGSVGAGSLRTIAPRIPGLQGVPWQAVSVEESLANSPASVVTMLLQRAKTLDVAVSLPSDLPDLVKVEVILEQLEDHLALPPLESAAQTKPSANPLPTPATPPR